LNFAAILFVFENAGGKFFFVQEKRLKINDPINKKASSFSSPCKLSLFRGYFNANFKTVISNIQKQEKLLYELKQWIFNFIFPSLLCSF
jgi:hypothetical protein